jgi:hypothetical protein
MNGWYRWGNEAHGIPCFDQEQIGAGTELKIPVVRDATPEEIYGIKHGTRPDLVEAIREYERLLALYNADLLERGRIEWEAKQARSKTYWAKRIAKHPELAAEREGKKTLQQSKAEFTAKFRARKEEKRKLVNGPPWWEVIADPVLYEAAVNAALEALT